MFAVFSAVFFFTGSLYAQNKRAARKPAISEIQLNAALVNTPSLLVQDKADAGIPEGEGALNLRALLRRNGRIQPYIWLGGRYKGLSWIIDSQRNYSLDPGREAQELVRRGDTLTYTQHIVNRPTEWQKPFTLVLGFEPTPVKPQAAAYRCTSQYMYDYDPAKGADFAGGMNATQWLLGYSYPIHCFPNGDDSYFRTVTGSRNRPLSVEERRGNADKFLARNSEWLRKNAPLASLEQIRRCFMDKRTFGQKSFLIYHNPAFYSCRWPEAEMYKAEWLPWDYPVDDAANEYIACQTSEYIDKMLYEMRYQARMGFDGMNFDCFPLGGGFNTVSMQAFREKPGRVPFITNDNMLQTAPPGITSATNLFG